MLIQYQFGIIQTFPIPQTSFLLGTFFAASYSKAALVNNLNICIYRLKLNCFARVFTLSFLRRHFTLWQVYTKVRSWQKALHQFSNFFVGAFFFLFTFVTKKSGRLKLTKICFEAQLNVPISQLDIKFLNFTGTEIKNLNSWKHQHCGQNDI